jgi:hypothetical protein
MALTTEQLRIADGILASREKTAPSQEPISQEAPSVMASAATATPEMAEPRAVKDVTRMLEEKGVPQKSAKRRFGEALIDAPFAFGRGLKETKKALFGGAEVIGEAVAAGRLNQKGAKIPFTDIIVGEGERAEDERNLRILQNKILNDPNSNEEQKKIAEEMVTTVDRSGDPTMMEVAGASAEVLLDIATLGQGKAATTAIKTIGKELIEEVGERGARKIITEIGKRIGGKELLKGSTVGAGFAAAGSMREGETELEEILGDAAIGAGIGLGAGVIGKVLSKALGKKSTKVGTDVVDEVTEKKTKKSILPEKRAGQIKEEVIESTEEAFRGATKQKESYDVAKIRSKDTSKELLKEFGKQEEILGQKSVPSFAKTKFKNTAVQKDVIDTFLNETDELIDRADIADNVLRLSEKIPTGGQSNFAASQVRKKLIESTSPEFAALSDEFADISGAIRAVEDNSFAKAKSIAQEMRLPPEIKKRISGVKSNEQKRALLEELILEKRTIGSNMSNEIERLRGQYIDGYSFRMGVEDLLENQKISIKKEPITTINKKDLDEIISTNPDDPRVIQLLEDQKILSTLEPKSAAFNLQGKVFDAQGKFQEKKVFDLLTQEKTTPEGALLRELLPKDLIDDITKKRVLTKKRVELIKGAIVGAAGTIGIGLTARLATS